MIAHRTATPATRVVARVMSKSEKYQRFAEECLEIAQTAKDNQAKAVLLHMAQVWFRLAAEHAEHAKGG